MTSLHIGLIVAGVLIVVAVLLYNQWQERRLRRRLSQPAGTEHAVGAPPRAPERIEPTLGAQRLATTAASTVTPAMRTSAASEPGSAAPGDPASNVASEMVPDVPDRRAAQSGVGFVPRESHATLAHARAAAKGMPQPDHEIECLIPLKPAASIVAGALAAGLHARIGKPLSWFARADARSNWERLASDTPGRFSEVVAAMLLADRNGAASRAQLDSFVRVVGDLAAGLPATFTAPDIERETARAESLDRLCAELDVQIGLTVQMSEPASIAGTRLRGLAEASGFRLAPGGRFEFVSEETGLVIYTLQNLRPDPFSAEMLRLTATNGVVFLLDVARIAEPVRVFDQMKLAARRMAKTLGAEVVDDNHRPLDDAALATIREQVETAADALRAVHIEPGSARALALFSA